jgi:hypothetical protein
MWRLLQVQVWLQAGEWLQGCSHALLPQPPVWVWGASQDQQTSHVWVWLFKRVSGLQRQGVLYSQNVVLLGFLASLGSLEMYCAILDCTFETSTDFSAQRE